MYSLTAFASDRELFDVNEVLYTKNRIIILTERNIILPRGEVLIDIFCQKRNGDFDSFEKLKFKKTENFLYSDFKYSEEDIKSKDGIIFNSKSTGYYPSCNIYADSKMLQFSFKDEDGKFSRNSWEKTFKYPNLIVKDDYMFFDFGLRESHYEERYAVLDISCKNNNIRFDFSGENKVLIKFIKTKLKNESRTLAVTLKDDALATDTSYKCETNKIILLR